jgi:hypothetical protein
MRVPDVEAGLLMDFHVTKLGNGIRLFVVHHARG